MRHAGRVVEERLHPAQAFRQREHPRRRRHGAGSPPAALEHHRDHPTKPFHLTGGQLIPGMIRQTRVQHTRHGGMPTEELCHLRRVGGVTFHPHSQCLDSPQDQPAVKRTGHRARRVLVKLQGLMDLLAVGHRAATHHVAMTA